MNAHDPAANTAESHASLVLGRQEPLRRRYRAAPQEAWITDRATAVGGADDDPFHGTLEAGDGYGVRWRVGIHRAVGGFHDRPNPGDILCAALAACFDTTLRMIAARMGISVTLLWVRVTGDVDVRGTLAVEREVPVGMQQMHCRLELGAAGEPPKAALERLVRATERACVVLQTLRNGVPIDLTLHPATAAHPGDGKAASPATAGGTVSAMLPPATSAGKGE
jgi:uncharacterized OsmC-like protein